MNPANLPRILIVDDEQHNLHVLGSALKYLAQVFVATSGEQALKKLVSAPYPDMILLDIVMPRINGFEVCRRIKGQPHLADIPVIFITAMDSEEDETRGFEVGAVDFIAKPIRPAIVAARVSTHLTLQARKRALIQSHQEADEANKAKGAFLATMSHEIRTPLNGMLGLAELLSEIDMPESGREYVRAILNSGRSLLTIVDDVLDYSKIEADKLHLESIPLDPRVLLNDLVLLFKGFAGKKQIAFEPRIADNLPDWVLGDPTRLRQVLVNLLSNAVKFTRVGSVTLSAAPVNDSQLRQALRFEVRDTGVGISREQFARLFQAFEQADCSTTRHFGGTGLGLAISRKLVRLMGGRIEVESEPGVGSQFVVLLPMRICDPPETAVAAMDGARVDSDFVRGARILVAEDDPINRAVLRGMLKRFDLEVSFAEDGRQVLEILENARFDLLFLDCQMPRLDGFATCREIREREQAGGRHMPIVAMTAYAMQGDRERCLAAGMDDYLAKPVSRRGMQSAIMRWLSRDAPLDGLALDGGSGPMTVLDRQAVGRLREALEGEFETLIQKFFKLMPERIEAMRRAVEQGQSAALIRMAHGLRGGASQLGALALAHCATSLEVIGERGQLAEALAWLSKLEEESVRLRDALHLEQCLFGFRQDLGEVQFGRFLGMANDSLSMMLERVGAEIAAGSYRRLAETARELSGLAGRYGLAELERLSGALEAEISRTHAMPEAARAFEESVRRAVTLLRGYAEG
ncbi:Sensor histidine kinase RcsC [Candidatus Magnetaquicoccaceae bacterium FCR-1]|uniref:histidine kinase n=1 Tax=Candidatus Magnetaquiglobus chichijimensis TaxID=3141448 RepID=A0ABQ0C681_9PROT